jgi:transcriptional regulator with XRE-family HTH domain
MEGLMKILIWEVRNKKGLSLICLSKLTGISKSALDNYESERRYPTIKQLELIANALDVKINDLYNSEYK